MMTAICPTCRDKGMVCAYYPIGRKVEFPPNVVVSGAYYEHVGGVDYSVIKAHYDVWCSTCHKKFIADWEAGGVKQWLPQKDSAKVASSSQCEACCFTCRYWAGSRRRGTAYCNKLYLGGKDAPSWDSVCAKWERRPNTRHMDGTIMQEYLLHALSDCLKDSMQLNRPLQIDDWIAIEDKLHKAAMQWWPLRKTMSDKLDGNYVPEVWQVRKDVIYAAQRAITLALPYLLSARNSQDGTPWEPSIKRDIEVLQLTYSLLVNCHPEDRTCKNVT